MTISYDLFLNWVKDYFGESNIEFAKGGEEICVPTPFQEDAKHHLWMNPSGGKSKHPENGSYRCWYTDRKGSLISLVSELEHIDWDTAEELITTETSLRALEEKLDNFFQTQKPKIIQQTNVGKIQLPKEAYLIDAINGSHRNKAVNYLQKRKIPTENLYIGIGGKYDHRIIIPYYDKEGELIWFNARTIVDDPKRYIKPDSTDELNQEKVLYLKRWPKTKTLIFLMEGEFDAISLDFCGYYAAACGGKSLSDTQFELLQGHTIVLAFDADIHGKKALIEIGNSLLEKGYRDVKYVRPPKAYKDWNKMLEKKNVELIRAYIQKFIKDYNIWTAEELLFN